MSEERRTVVIVDDYDRLLDTIDGYRKSAESAMVRAATAFAESAKAEDRERYRGEKATMATLDALRADLIKQVRRPLPVEIEALKAARSKRA